MLNRISLIRNGIFSSQKILFGKKWIRITWVCTTLIEKYPQALKV